MRTQRLVLAMAMFFGMVTAAAAQDPVQALRARIHQDQQTLAAVAAEAEQLRQAGIRAVMAGDEPAARRVHAAWQQRLADAYRLDQHIAVLRSHLAMHQQQQARPPAAAPAPPVAISSGTQGIMDLTQGIVADAMASARSVISQPGAAAGGSLEAQAYANLLAAMQRQGREIDELAARARRGDRQAAEQLDRWTERLRRQTAAMDLMIQGNATSNQIRSSVQRQQQAMDARGLASQHRQAADYYARTDPARADWHRNKAAEYVQLERRLVDRR